MRPELRDQRQRRIGEAVLRLAARDGIDAVSLRSVAHEANGSMGQVQYQFGTVADLLRYATELAIAHLRQHLADDPAPAGQERLKQLARALLDDDPEIRTTLRALAQLRTAAARDPRVAALVADLNRRQRDELAAILTSAQDRRLLHRMVQPEAEADVFWTLMLAMATEVAQDLRDRDDGLAALRYHFLSLARNKKVTRAPRAK